ncbi:MAG: multicomponent Na+:H+ antiporter subunit C [Verrucomicrobiales bacterium]|jgi:multicomponent Na+:H+ antiporter subunit C
MDLIFSHLNFYVYVILMMIGMWAMIAKNNLIKKLIGMSIFQTAIILFFVSLGVKSGEAVTIPVLEYEKAEHVEPAAAGHEKGDHDEHHAKKKNTDHSRYANPLPHVLMLTAIVVGVATLGVALAISQHVFHDFESLEEDEIIEKIRDEHG